MPTPAGSVVTRSQLLALLDSVGATEDDSVLHFFSSSVHYVEDGVVALARESGLSPKGVFVKAVPA